RPPSGPKVVCPGSRSPRPRPHPRSGREAARGRLASRHRAQTHDARLMDELARLLAEHDDWLVVERGLAVNSLVAYRRDLRRYATFLRAHAAADCSRISEARAHACVRHLETLGDAAGRRRLAASSVARAVVAVGSFH